MSHVKEIPPQELRKMQLLQFDMLVEMDRVCRANGIPYTISNGTLLGAIRHKGYIPWDDDADTMMLRQDYEKFKQCADQLNPDICFFQDHSTDPEYRWGYGKLRRTGTEYIRAGQEHMKNKTGLFIDVFPMHGFPELLYAKNHLLRSRPDEYHRILEVLVFCPLKDPAALCVRRAGNLCKTQLG